VQVERTEGRRIEDVENTPTENVQGPGLKSSGWEENTNASGRKEFVRMCDIGDPIAESSKLLDLTCIHISQKLERYRNLTYHGGY
jgi:hypothetical protein